jgi:hypothetical protein
VPTAHGFGLVVLSAPQCARTRMMAKADAVRCVMTSRVARALAPKYFKFPYLTQNFSTKLP